MTAAVPQQPNRVRTALRRKAVLEKTGLSATHLHRLIQCGKFPSPHKLSERVSAWDSAEVDAWLAEKFAS
jgi:predicted DNA-binding transcriptional regulator AlpA